MKRVPLSPEAPTTEAVPTEEPTSDTPAPILLGGLAADLGSALELTDSLSLDEGFPWLGFFSTRSERAADIQNVLGQVAEGTPYVSAQGTYFNATGFSFLSLREEVYWGKLDASFNLEAVTFTAQPFGSEYKENILSVTMLLPGTDPLPPELAPALVTMTTWRSTKCPALKQHLKAVRRAGEPEWVRQGGNGAIAGAVSVRYRIASALRVESHTARSGFTYQKARAISQTVNVAQLEALRQWGEDASKQSALADLIAQYDTRVAELKTVGDNS